MVHPYTMPAGAPFTPSNSHQAAPAHGQGPPGNWWVCTIFPACSSTSSISHGIQFMW